MAEFKVKHMMIANVKGQFPKISGALFLDESDLANSRVEASIEAASIHTRDEQRDAHLKSADFFLVEKFPTLHFKSTGISIVRDGELLGEKVKVIANEEVKAAIQKIGINKCARESGFDRKNFIRKLVRGIPVKRNSYTEFVRWLERPKVVNG